jgi:hypothetical protein
MRYLGCRFVVLLSLTHIGGCAPPPTSNVNASVQAPDRPVIAEPCQFSSALASSSSDPKQLRIFVELATVEGDWGAAMSQPGSGQAAGTKTPTTPSFTDLLNDPRFTVPSVGNVLLSSDVQTTLDFTPVRGVAAISLGTHLPSKASASLV